MNNIRNLFIVSLAFVVTLAYPSGEDLTNDMYKHCLRPCPAIYLPICGYDGYQNRLFSSDCDMEVQNCVLQVKKARVFMETAMHMCEEKKEKKCNNVCTREYAPLCGFDGKIIKTFPNKCVFESENCESNNSWSLLKSGECNVEQNIISNEKSKPCNNICTLDYRPVCGSDGKTEVTYGNMCSFEAANCNSNFKLQLLKAGQC